MKKKVFNGIIDFIIILATFEITDLITLKVFHTEKWYAHLLVYMVAYMLLELVKGWFVKKHAAKQQEKAEAETE